MIVSGTRWNRTVELVEEGCYNGCLKGEGMTGEEIKEGLDRWFGYEDFREGQAAPIEAVVNGRDAVVIMPTGAGKSLCFQLPALLMEGVTIVISPLIALMRDQVAALERRQIPATFINSTLDGRTQDLRVQEMLAGSYKLVYVAPERLANPAFAAVLKKLDIAFLAVDEAHCISQWGHDFRPDYLALGDLIAAHPKMRVMAVTATATPGVREDIIKQLRLKGRGDRDLFVQVQGFSRLNLNLAVAPCRTHAVPISFAQQIVNERKAAAKREAASALRNVPSRTASRGTPPAPTAPGDLALASELRTWRKEVASELGIPAFRIMTNKTLDALVAERPTTLAALSSIYGLYRQTREEYGEDILDIIRNAH